MAEESPPISPGSGRVSPALSSTSGSENEMDEDWNFVQLSAGGQVSAGGSETPMTNSSCEFVRVAGDGATYHRSDNASDTSDDNEGTQSNDDISASTAINDLDITPQVAETAATVTDNPGNTQQASQAAPQTDQSTESVFVGGAAAAGEPTKDEELRSLMEKLQEKVRSGSPCNSVSTDSDFVQLPQSIVERDELMDVSVSSSAGSRFNIIIQRDQQPFQHSDEEEEEAELLGQQRDRREGDPISDPDDRVESDILAARLVTEPRDDFPDNNDLIAEPVRHYRHSPNRDLNTLLTAIALTAIGFALGIAVGHSVGSAREAVLQQEIQEGQKLRLRSVQDDLLMCLRKQEDIDQTINKLNEIENILVDAEHWRNEYEELLNLKLGNEEKWRQDRGKLHTTLAELERSHDRLMNSKSCAHDSEYLSRQESTLKSVHEKLEASLNDKDQQIINMQTELADHKINLRTAEEMANAYRKSNEDKSILILNLKEQLLELEREVFDLRVNSEIAMSGGQQHNNTEPSSATPEEVNMSNQGAERTQEVVTTNHPAENQEEDMQAAPVMTTGHIKTLDLLERDLITCHLKVEALQTQLDTEPVMQNIETTHAVENRATGQGHLSSPAAGTSEDMEEASVEIDGTDDHPRFTSGPSDGESHNTVINNLQQQVARLQLQVQKHKLRQLKNTPHHLPDVSKNATDMPCVVLNVCDKLTVNITSLQLLRLYNASKQQYKSVEAFVLAEWKAISDEFRTSLNGSNFPFDQTMWRQYLNETQSAFSSFLWSFNSTLEDIKNFSQTVLQPGSAQQKPGFQKKLQRKLSKVAKTVQKGFNHVKSGIVDKLGSLISDFTNDGQQENKRKGGGEKKKQGRNSKSDPKKQTKTTAEPVQEKRNSKQTRKFEKRLEKLRQDLYNMDSWRAQKMKRYEQENLYDRFEDFGYDYKYMFSNPDLGDVKSWVNCQSSWWKHHVYGGRELGDMTGCADQLMAWQMGSGLHQSSDRPSHDQSDDTEYESFEGYVDVDDYNPVIIEDIGEDYDDAADSADVDSSWQFQRAEWRKYHRDEPDDWYWRRAHDHEHTPENNKHPTNIPFPKDEF